MSASLLKVCIIGSGNWGSVIAKIVATNVPKHPEKFAIPVTMYVYEELIDGVKLTEIINTQHENVKYLPGCKLPENVVACSDVLESAKDADILVFVMPHQFIGKICQDLNGQIKKSAVAVSLIKGLETKDGRLSLISNVIRKTLGIPVAVLMGANVANEVAAESFCESTIGCRNASTGSTLKEIFQTPYFRISVVPDEETVELCGALKNVVAIGAGFMDGLRQGDNTKAAIIRLGLMEIISFCKYFYPQTKIETFLESCGVADLITTCYSGRNRKVAAAFAANPQKSLTQLEQEMLNGQKLQGPSTAADVCSVLSRRDTSGTNLMQKFPIFTSVHKICSGEMQPDDFIETLKDHPEHR